MTEAPYSRDWLRRLALESLFQPRTAVAELLAFPLPRQALMLWLALLSVLNGILYSLTLPNEAQLGLTLPEFVKSPIVLSVFFGIVMLLMTWFFHVAGRMLQGEGTFEAMLQTVCWLQSLRLICQAAVTLVALLSPGLGGLVALAAWIWSLYILASFLAGVHRFDNAMRGIGVMVLGIIGVAIAMTFLMTLAGVGPSGS